MECRLLVTVGVCYPREQFVQAISEKLNERQIFNKWHHDTLIAGEKDMIRTYSRMLDNPRFRSPMHQKDFTQSLIQSKKNYRELIAVKDNIPDYLTIMLERQFTSMPDLRVIRDYFRHIMKIKEGGFGIEMSSDARQVYVTHVESGYKYAKDPSMYQYQIPIAFFVKNKFNHANTFCELVGLQSQKPIIIIDHYNGRQFEK